jgi:hypothetical protein
LRRRVPKTSARKWSPLNPIRTYRRIAEDLATLDLDPVGRTLSHASPQSVLQLFRHRARRALLGEVVQ